MRRLLVAGIWLLILPVMLEGLLRLLDPWGAVTYFTTGGPPVADYVPYGERYALPPGQYSFPSWTAHINDDFTRAVPDNRAGTCRIAFVGDSVTFGLGVNDTRTWVNLLAGRHPAWDVVNAGVPGYNSTGAWRTINDTRAAAYVYLITNNDAEPFAYYPDLDSPQRQLPALAIYWRVWQIRRRGYQHPAQISGSRRRFDADLDALALLPNLLLAGFAGDSLAESAAQQHETVVLLPPYSQTISFANSHPNAAGHQQIAAAIEPHVMALAEQHC